MSIFSRFNDIINSNLNAMLDKAEHPEKIIRLVVQEMEDTLVEVRTSAARTIADQKTLNRRLDRLRDEAREWEQKAELAVRKDREDLARAALAEKTSLYNVIRKLEDEITEIDDQLERLNEDIARLQAKLTEAKVRQKSLLMRNEAVNNRLKTRDRLNDKRIDDAMSKFDHLEQKMDHLEGKVEVYDLGQERTLVDEFAELEAQDSVEKELEALRKRVGKEVS